MRWSGSRIVGSGFAGSRVRNGCVTRYSCAIGTIGMRTPASRPSSAAYMPPARRTRSASIVPRSVTTAADAPAVPLERRHPRAGVDVDPARPRAVGQRVGQLGRVQVAVRRQPRRREHAGVGHQREALHAPRRGRPARAVGRTSAPSPPAGASPPGARASTPGAGRRTRPSRSRASGRARRSASSSGSASRSRAAGRRARPSGRSTRTSAGRGRPGRRRGPRPSAPGGRRSSIPRPRRRR